DQGQGRVLHGKQSGMARRGPQTGAGRRGCRGTGSGGEKPLAADLRRWTQIKKARNQDEGALHNALFAGNTRSLAPVRTLKKARPHKNGAWDDEFIEFRDDEVLNEVLKPTRRDH